MANETILCLRCKSALEASQTVYVIPEGKRSNPGENKVELTRAVNVQMLRCSNPECDFIEFKAPKDWPSFVPRQS
jgi:hypothetical protein